jgi:hypothetical protein
VTFGVGSVMEDTPAGLEHLKEDVRRKLSELNLIELTQVSGELSLTIPVGKETKKSAVYNLIARHLMTQEDDEDDEGKAVFQACGAAVDQILDAKAKDKLAGKQKAQKDEDVPGKSTDTTNVEVAEMKSTGLGEGPGLQASAPASVSHRTTRNDASQSGASASTITVPYHKIREFKITGGVVGAEENALDLTDIQFQMKEGSDLGYTPREIRAGVIKAMKGGSEIRRYFERKVDQFDEDEFMEMLELWYTEKEASELMDAMSACVQGPKETAKKYVVKMFEKRDHIMEVTAKEEDPLAQSYVQKKMLRAISVGLRRDVVRLQLINVLSDPKISDAKIMKELEGITTRDVENRTKMEKSGGKASVNSLQDHTGGNAMFNGSRDPVQQPQTMDAISRIEKQLGQMSVTMCDMASGKSDVEKRLKRLESLLADGYAGGARRKFPKCEKCEVEKKFCTHCSNCGESGHKNKDCLKPKNC